VGDKQDALCARDGVPDDRRGDDRLSTPGGQDEQRALRAAAQFRADALDRVELVRPERHYRCLAPPW
jgi:hypothetical protein